MSDTRTRDLPAAVHPAPPARHRSRLSDRPSVARTALVDVVAGRAGDVLISAPAGYGKSTLVSQWMQAGADAALVSLDGGHDDPVALWSAVLDAVGDIGRDQGELARASLQRIDRLTRLLDDLAPSLAGLTLVLDDFQWITDPACLASIDHLLHRRRTARPRLVLSTRVDPPFELARLRLAGRLVELGAADLSFTRAEAVQLFGQRGIHLSEHALDHLYDLTEGWPAGLGLAALAMEGGADPEDVARSFGGHSRLVADYLDEEVMGALDAERRSFVTVTSILESLCGPLCDAVTGRSQSADLLVGMERDDLFLVPLDDHREWYRYHRLFAGYLAHNTRLDAHRRNDLHLRAARWFQAGGRTHDAVAHFLAGGDTAAATDAVADAYPAAVESGGVDVVLGWLDLFPRRAITRDARLSVVEAWVMSILQRPADAEAALANARACTVNGPLPDGASSVEASAALIQAAFPAGHVGNMADAARRALSLEGHPDSPLCALVHVLAGVTSYFAGDADEAVPLLERAAALARVSERWMNESGACTVRAWAAVDAGAYDIAHEWANRAVEVARSVDCLDTPYGGYALATLAVARWRRDGSVEAARDIAPALETARTGVEPLVLAQCLLAAAGVHRVAGDLDLAEAECAEATTLLAGFRDPGMLGERAVAIAASLRRGTHHGGPAAVLSAREREVLTLLGRGLTKREAADALYVSYNTVHTHTRSIYRKLGVTDRNRALEVASERGLLQPG